MASSSTTAPSTSTPTLNLHFSPEWMRTTSTSKLASPATGLHGPDSSLSPTTSAANAGGTSGLMTPAPSASSVLQSGNASGQFTLSLTVILATFGCLLGALCRFTSFPSVMFGSLFFQSKNADCLRVPLECSEAAVWLLHGRCGRFLRWLYTNRSARSFIHADILHL